MRYLVLALLILCALTATPVIASDFNLPGLERESQTYSDRLTAKFPSGASVQARQQADRAAEAAYRKQDWPLVVSSLETRVGQGDASQLHWLVLAQAQLKRKPAEPRRALEAAWLAFTSSDSPKDESLALLVMVDALKLLDRPVQVIQTLEAAAERMPDDQAIKRSLTEARRAAGVLVKRVTTESEADPPRACLEFTVAPIRRDSFNPRDWVKVEPQPAGLAVTREGDLLCVSGLPSGRTTRLTVLAGMPGEDQLTVARDQVFTLNVANKRPRIDLDTRLFVLPRGQVPSLSVTTVNLSALTIKLARLTERNVVSFIRDARLGQPVELWTANDIGERIGSVVWEGHAAIPKWEPNQPARTALPIPDELTKAGPGLYALIVQAGDGTPGNAAAVQMIARTDLAPTVWRGSDGLTVQVRGFSDIKPRADVLLRLLADNNDILAEVHTDALGVGRFALPLLRGEGPLAPRAIHAFAPDNDFAVLDLTSAAFDLSDRGVSGAPHPGPLDAFVWLDRGIYRPGESVQIMALLRDEGGLPVDVPARVIVRRPNGQVFLEQVVARTTEGAVHVPLALSAGAQFGTWTAEVKVDPAQPPIGSTSFRVDAFVPDRMAVELGPVNGPINPSQAYTVPVSTRFLYGAPGSGLTGKGSLRLVVDPSPFKTLAGYKIGLDGETYAPDVREYDLPETDRLGNTSLTIPAASVPDTSFALKAAIEVSVDDPSGHGARGTVEVPVRPFANLIGIKPAFVGNAVDQGAEAAFDLAAANPDGNRVSVNARVRLVRERPDWRMVNRGGTARYETVWRDEPLTTSNVAIPAGDPLRVAHKLDFGRYRIEVSEAGGIAATSVRFRVGWVSSDSPDVPDMADISADKKVYGPGDVARIRIMSPFAGDATLLVLTDRVHTLRTVAVASGGTDVEIPIDPAWGPGAYVALHVFRPTPDAKSQPARAIGVTWLGIDPAARQLPLSFEAAPKYAPRARATVRLRTAPGAWVSVAAVDEGILRLTSFVSPDPAPHFLGRRLLAVDIRDDWGRLIRPAEGDTTVLRQGGDDGRFVMPDIPQRTVSLFMPPVQAGADGTVEIPLDLPDFNGQVRLMAVGWSERKIGAVSTAIIVRDPLVAEPLLPRFLAPGDETRLTVLLHSLDQPAGESVAEISVDGPLMVSGPARLVAQLAPGARALPTTVLKATGAGRGVVRLDVTGTDGFKARREMPIWVRPVRGATTVVATTELPAGAEASVSPPAERFVAGTWQASATFGSAVRYDVAGLVASLDRYPLNCLEQAISRGLPLTALADGPIPGADRAGRLQQAIGLVLDRQRYDGGFALWTSGGSAEPWLSLYATEFLLRARAAGGTITEQTLVDAIRFISENGEHGNSEAAGLALQAYRFYVLALAGQGKPGAARVLMEQLGRLPTSLSKAHLGAALALAGDKARAELAFSEALKGFDRRWWDFDYGTSLRDQTAIAVLLKESTLLPDRLAKLGAILPGSDLSPDALNTQEQAWAAMAGAVLGRGMAAVRISVAGRDLSGQPPIGVAVTQAISVRNLGEKPVSQTLSATGVPSAPQVAARSQMRLTRKFFAMDGQVLDVDKVTQNTAFVLLLEGRAEDGQAHRVMIQHGLPAGWELAGRFPSGDVPGLAWLGKLTETESQVAADDRFAAVAALSANQPAFRVAVRVRAVTPGTYELPGGEVSDMYRPGIFARQNPGRIVVRGTE